MAGPITSLANDGIKFTEQPAAFEKLKTAYQKWNSQMLPLPAQEVAAEAPVARPKPAEANSSVQDRGARVELLPVVNRGGFDGVSLSVLACR